VYKFGVGSLLLLLNCDEVVRNHAEGMFLLTNTPTAIRVYKENGQW